MKRTILTFICKTLEQLCVFTHPFADYEIRLTGTHCNLTNLSLYIDDKYDLGVWNKPNQKEDKDYDSLIRLLNQVLLTKKEGREVI